LGSGSLARVGAANRPHASIIANKNFVSISVP
jgi:hypothetical protein